MRNSNWYYTVVLDGESAIEYAVVCVDDTFDEYIKHLRAAGKGLAEKFGEDASPAISIAYPHVALVKVLHVHSQEDLEESIDNADGAWGELPLAPLQELLFDSGELDKSFIFASLRETEVEGSTARLEMLNPNHVRLVIDPGDSSTPQGDGGAPPPPLLSVWHLARGATDHACRGAP